MYKITVFTYESSALCLKLQYNQRSPPKTTALLTKAVALAQKSTLEFTIKIHGML